MKIKLTPDSNKPELPQDPQEELAFPQLHTEILKIFETLPRGVIFDGAGGNGILSRNLIKMGFKVFSTDIAVRDNLQKGLSLYQSNLNRDLAHKNARFDYCVCLETIEHLENPWHFIRELARVLKPGGRLILSTPNIDYLTCKVCFLFKGSFYPFFGDWQYSVIGHITPLSKYYLTRILKKYGFEIELITYNRYRIPFFKIASPFKTPLFGEDLIIQSIKA